MKELFVNLKFASKYCKQKFKIFVFIVMNLFNVSVNTIIPIFFAKVVVDITDNQLKQIIILAFVILFLCSISLVLDHFVVILSKSIYNNALSNIQMSLASEVLKLENSSIDQNGTGVFIERLSSDSQVLADIFNSLTDKISYILMFVGSLTVIFLTSDLVFLYVLIGIILTYMLIYKNTKKLNNEDRKFRLINERVTGLFSELVRGTRDIKMLNSEDAFVNEYKARFDKVNESKYNIRMMAKSYDLEEMCLYHTVSFVLLLIIALLLVSGGLTPVAAIIVWNYSNNITDVNYFVTDLMTMIRNFNLSCERVRELIDGKRFRKEEFGKVHLNRIEGNFEFKNVSFKYDKKKVLDKLSFKVKANQIVAFVGKSGAGKTTIFNLLCKMYNVNSGKILIDGVDINDLDKDTIRGNITVISQNPYIFNLSIRDNLKLVKEDMSEEEMVRACKGACLHDFIMKLPKKYDTVVGEGGVMLSGGEKQRLAIARALLQRTEIILFDEATSALDNETQSKVQEAIENMKGEYTILIIAHRLSTIMNADKIYFINQGKVEAEGTHKGLLRKCKDYRHLYESELE